jgi:hypothetical protein
MALKPDKQAPPAFPKHKDNNTMEARYPVFALHTRHPARLQLSRGGRSELRFGKLGRQMPILPPPMLPDDDCPF